MRPADLSFYTIPTTRHCIISAQVDLLIWRSVIVFQWILLLSNFCSASESGQFRCRYSTHPLFLSAAM